MAYSPLAIANEFIAIAASEGSKIEHMKLQKLVHLLTDMPSKREMSSQMKNRSRKYGPVFSSLYAELGTTVLSQFVSLRMRISF